MSLTAEWFAPMGVVLIVATAILMGMRSAMTAVRIKNNNDARRRK